MTRFSGHVNLDQVSRTGASSDGTVRLIGRIRSCRRPNLRSFVVARWTWSRRVALSLRSPSCLGSLSPGSTAGKGQDLVGRA